MYRDKIFAGGSQGHVCSGGIEGYLRSIGKRGGPLGLISIIHPRTYL